MFLFFCGSEDWNDGEKATFVTKSAFYTIASSALCITGFDDAMKMVLHFLLILSIFFSFFLVDILSHALHSQLIKSFPSSVPSFYLIYYENKAIYEIPDNTTLLAISQELSLPINEIPEVPLQFIPNLLQSQGFTPSLLTSNNSRIILSEILERSLFYKDESVIHLKNIWNPSIVYWQGRYLLCWRGINPEDGSGTGKLAFGWLSTDGKSIDPKGYLGLGGDNLYPIVSEGAGTNGEKIEQEDPRLLVLSSTQLLIAFTGFFPDPKKPHKRIGKNIQCFTIAEYQPELETIIIISPTNNQNNKIIIFDQQFDTPRQKNWVPFLYNNNHNNNSIYFIQNIGKMKIYKFLQLESETSNRGVLEEISTSILHARNNPWKSKLFGGHLRGGTPAILIHQQQLMMKNNNHNNQISGIFQRYDEQHHHQSQKILLAKSFYITLFHTSYSHRFSEYFMGAMLFCSKPPFQIHAISSYPILRTEKFYTGEFINGFLHYVVYPSGLIIDPNDSNTLLVSFGHQDKQGYLVKMNLTALIDSLFPINTCPD